MTWSDTLSDNGIMMEEGEAAKALALGISEKTALSGGTTSVDVSGMCSSLFEMIDWGFCDAVDQVISVIAPRFMAGNNSVYSSNISELITVAGFTTAVYGATNGEVRLRNGGVLFDSEWIKQRKGILNLFVTASTPVTAAVFTKSSLASNTWTVTGSTVSGATTTLPHSLDPVGSTASTPTSYFRGVMTYSTNVTLDSSKRYYLYLDPVYQRADVVLNGSTATTLEVYGATSANHVFTEERPGIPTVIDLTGVPFANGGNTLTIRTDNTKTFYDIPYDGVMNSYNILGGVTLCEAGSMCFDPVTYGTRRCHLEVSATKVIIKFAVKCNSNQSSTLYANVYTNVYEGEGTTPINDTVITEIEVNPGETKTYTVTFNLGRNLSTTRWGLGNGNLYRVKLELNQESSVRDTIEEHFGYRTFSVAKHTSNDGGYGLTLSGSTTSLYGVTYHHWDRLPTTAELDADWAIITALKPQMIRFAYFPALHYLLDKCDEAGIVAMIEIPWMHDFHTNKWSESDMEGYRTPWRYRYQHNVTANAVAMANEFYNHPSVLFYTIGTGFSVKTYHEYYDDQAYTFITEELLPALRAADSTRLVCLEQAGNSGSAWTDASDILLERMNSGWGSGSISNAVSEANTWNGKNATLPLGFIDWSYGANPDDHVEWSSASTKPENTSLNNAVEYPEEYQAYCVEQYTASALALKWPVFNLYGSVFDYAAAEVSAGGKSGIMQTGLVTRNRSVFKDAYYYLKAMWNPEPMVHITQKRNMAKEYSPLTLRIYTNCAYVKVYSSSMTLLDTLEKGSGSYVVTKSVELEEGTNIFYVTGHTASNAEASCTDSVTITYEDTSGTTHIQIYSDSAIVNAGYLDASVIPSTEPQGVTWSSETPAIATVNSGGTVTVLADGMATVRATSTSDNTITKTKAIPCYVRGATDSLYYKACLDFDDASTVSYRGLTITRNHDGTETINGTLTFSSASPSNYFMWPSVQNSASTAITNRALFPVWDIPGDQLITCDVLGGTITGSTTGDPIVMTPIDQDFNPLQQAALKPLNQRNGSADVNAKLITGSTLGFCSFRVTLNYANGTVFDNVVLRVQSYKQADSYYNEGLFEGHLLPINTLILHDKDASYYDPIKANSYMRNADGSHSEFVGNPNNGTSIPSYGRVTDGFAIGRNSVSEILSGSTIATAGTVLKFTVVMKNWPPYYIAANKGEENAEWSFCVWYADGTLAAKLYWAHGYDDTGVDFTGGTASTTFIAEKTVDCAGWYRYYFGWGGNLSCHTAVTWQMKLEEVDPSNVPPTSITTYASSRIVNTGYANAVISPAGSNQGITWSSSNTSVATIDSSTGFITVVSDGQCTFTATSTVDNTKSGSVTVTCHKSTTTNEAEPILELWLVGSTATYNNVVATNNGDGTITLNGTVNTANAVTVRAVPLASAAAVEFQHFPRSGIAGDVLVWMEYVSGTISNASTYNGYDFEVRCYDESNSMQSAYNLNYVEKPTASGDTQNVLVTGSTSGVRRVTLAFKRPNGTVFDNYTVRIGVEKYSSLGNVYNGGLIETALPSLCEFWKFDTKNIPCARYPDGSIIIRTANSATWASRLVGYITLTNGVALYDYSNGNGIANIPVTNVLATSGKTYKFSVKLITACTFDTSKANTNLSFCVLGSNRTVLATLQAIANNAATNTFDSNGEAEITFSATENVACVYIAYDNIKLTNFLCFGIKLEEVTTT